MKDKHPKIASFKNNIQPEIEMRSESQASYKELERRIYTALQRYSNVHRSAGHYSIVSTKLYELARDIVLEYLVLDKNKYTVIFGNTRILKILNNKLKRQDKSKLILSKDLGLPLGVGALAVRKKDLSKGVPLQTGGGIIKLVAPYSVVWTKVPNKFEAGTPNIIGIITFATALRMIRAYGTENIFKHKTTRIDTKDILFNDDLKGYEKEKLLSQVRETLVGLDILVPTSKGKQSYINFDNYASTPTFESIWNVFRMIWRQPDEVLHDIVNEVENICADFFNAPIDDFDIIFTSNTTEGINIVASKLKNVVQKDKHTKTVVLNTLLEHHSNELPWRYISGVTLKRLSVDNEGFLDLKQFETVLSDYNYKKKYGKRRIKIVAVSGASNVLGTMNDIKKISQISHSYGAIVLIDAAQLAAHGKINMQEMGIDCLAFSGHKMYAPFGAGGLIIRKELRKAFLGIDDNDFETLKLSGKENVAGISAMGKAMNILEHIGTDVINRHERKLTAVALKGFSKIKDIEIFGILDPKTESFNRRGGVVVFNMRKIPHNLVSKMLAEKGGIGARDGCFCAHLVVKHLMKVGCVREFIAMILISIFKSKDKLLPGIVRIGFGIENTEEEVEHLIKILHEISKEPVSSINRFIAHFYNGTSFLPHTAEEKRIDNFVEAAIKDVYYSSEKDRE